MQVSLPVAQIVAGFSKVFVGEIVEKGACLYQLTLDADGFVLQRVRSKHGGESLDRCRLTTSARRIGCIRRRRGASELPVP
jgi:hypothetical protein